MDNPNAAKLEDKPKETWDEYMERMIREMEEDDKRHEEEQAKIKARKSLKKQVQDKNPPSVGGEDEHNAVTTGTDGTDEQQLDVMPAANPFLELVPEAAGGGYMSSSANPDDPVLGLHIQRPNTSREELEDEALELMQILRDCIFKTSELTGFLAGHPELIGPFSYDVSMLDATSAFLSSMMGPVNYGNVRPTAEQIWRRSEIRNRHYRAINQMRRIPGKQEDVDYTGVGVPGSTKKKQAQSDVEGNEHGGSDSSQRNAM